MEYISESPKHCSKGVLQCVQNCTNLPRNRGIGYMFETNCSSLHQLFRKKLIVITNKRGGKLTFPIFDNEFLSSSKKKLALKTIFLYQT